MAPKRKVADSFEQPQGTLSAFAAAKLARQQRLQTPSEPTGTSLATAVASLPYDENISRGDSPDADDAAKNEHNNLAQAQPGITADGGKRDNIVAETEDSLEIQLRPGESAIVVGEYDVKVLVPHGVVSISGSLLRAHDNPLRVFAPTTHALPCIQTRGNATRIRLTSIQTGMRGLVKLAPAFRQIWTSSVHEQRSFSYLGTWNSGQIPSTLHTIVTEKSHEATLRTLAPKLASLKGRCRVMAIGAKSSGKSTFNRTLYNSYHSISQGGTCLYLDLDPGQPEFGPPGQLSLVEVTLPLQGPAFTHPTSSLSSKVRRIRSHTIAAMSFKDDPDHYQACALDLVGHAGKRYPLIVNSSGWVSGLGEKVLLRLAPSLDLSDLIFLDPVPDPLRVGLLAAIPGAAVHHIDRHISRPSLRTPAESRAMQTMAYFHHRPSIGDAPSTWSSKPISTVRPWIVDYAGPDGGILAIVSYGQGPSPDFLAEVLDGSIVALVVVNEAEGEASSMFSDSASTNGKAAGTGPLQQPPGPHSEADQEDPQATAIAANAMHTAHPPRSHPHATTHDFSLARRHTPEGIPYIAPNTQGVNRTLDPRRSRCIGLALIRGIDVQKRQLHLVTPLREEEVMSELARQRVVLVRGGFDAPEWAYLEGVYFSQSGGTTTTATGGGRRTGAGAGDRPWVSQREMVGVEGSEWRLRHPPTPGAAVGSGSR